jgi:hypothetical protein
VECASWNNLEAKLSKVEEQKLRKKILERSQEKAKAEQHRKRGM